MVPRSPVTSDGPMGDVMSKLRISVVVAGLMISTAALAATQHILGGDAWTSPVTGVGEDLSPVFGPDGAHQALYGVAFYEQRGRATEATLMSRDLNTGDDVKTAMPVGPDWTKPMAPLTLQFNNQDTYVRGIAVCVNAKGERIKGVRIYGTKLDRETGALTEAAETKEFARPNCTAWQDAQYCPDTHVATGLHHTNAADKGFSGLALRCQQVEPG